MNKIRSKEQAVDSILGTITAGAQEDASTSAQYVDSSMGLTDVKWDEANEATETGDIKAVPSHRTVPYRDDAATELASTAQEYDNQASLDEGHVMSTLHHLLILKTGKTSWFARKMVAAELEDMFTSLVHEVGSSVFLFSADHAVEADDTADTFRNRILKMLTSALYVQFAPPDSDVEKKVLHDSCVLEARSWTLEILARWDLQLRAEVKQCESLKTSKHEHMVLASRPGVED